jgi:hypothetical protein
VLPPGGAGLGDGEVLGEGVGFGEAVGLGVGFGDVVGDGAGDVVGDGPPVQAPRSFHSDGVDAGFQPVPGHAVCATRAEYRWEL